MSGSQRDRRKVTDAGQGRISPLPAPPAKLVVVVVVVSGLGSGSRTFYLQIIAFSSGGTRIRTGGTMIFRHVQESG